LPSWKTPRKGHAQLRRNRHLDARFDEVWYKTHRLGGKLFVLAGRATFVLALGGAGPVAIFIVVGAAGGLGCRVVPVLPEDRGLQREVDSR
jgi:hypothetical protein